jgi:beta-lactamase class A
MNNSLIEQAKDRDLAGSVDAMRRAAIRARQIAAQTGTDLIVWRDGKVQHETVTVQETAPKRAVA